MVVAVRKFWIIGSDLAGEFQGAEAVAGFRSSFAAPVLQGGGEEGVSRAVATPAAAEGPLLSVREVAAQLKVCTATV